MKEKLILSQDVEYLGLAGEVVEVAKGYARNYLLPKKFALKATPANEKALAAAQKGEDFQVGDVYVCAKCGYTVEGSAPDRCPLCGEPKERFERID